MSVSASAGDPAGFRASGDVTLAGYRPISSERLLIPGAANLRFIVFGPWLMR